MQQERRYVCVYVCLCVCVCVCVCVCDSKFKRKKSTSNKKSWPALLFHSFVINFHSYSLLFFCHLPHCPLCPASHFRSCANVIENVDGWEQRKKRCNQCKGRKRGREEEREGEKEREKERRTYWWSWSRSHAFGREGEEKEGGKEGMKVEWEWGKSKEERKEERKGKKGGNEMWNMNWNRKNRKNKYVDRQIERQLKGHRLTYFDWLTERHKYKQLTDWLTEKRDRLMNNVSDWTTKTDKQATDSPLHDWQTNKQTQTPIEEGNKQNTNLIRYELSHSQNGR